MAKEEARIGVYRQKAETLAKELNDMNLELLTFNEFLDRVRIGDDVSGVKEDALEIRHENEALIANLENDFSRLKGFEAMIRKNEEELGAITGRLNALRSQFSEEQRTEFGSLQKASVELGKECQSLEGEIAQWNGRKEEVLERTNREGSVLKMQMVQAVATLRQLDKQRTELTSADSGEESERGHLLAQVKRDNNYIASLEAKTEALAKALEEANGEIEFYRDGAKVIKFADLKQKEKTFDDFMASFTEAKEDRRQRMETVNHEITDISNKLARCLKYLNILKQISDVSTGAYNILNELIIQKRKLELELNKNQQMTAKASTEKEILSNKIGKLQESINSYSDISKLKAQVEARLENTKQATEKARQEMAAVKLQMEGVSSELREIRMELEKSAAFGEARQLEEKLRALLRVNETLKANDKSQMMGELKSIVLEKAKTYNQTLMGF
ncbi:PREDICTED: intraflagellar transport protein 74 homolog [Rhagoletis zephyria]|uniref:intraflagellar transport protein 74 homolog n=1 Tax=Rhagoletis zephyria TaxID=28612 RepID=UPI000811724D|nr:PREDICTED: intraflagellar transport protein 74 homolog [Rhagoletis zephyria]